MTWIGLLYKVYFLFLLIFFIQVSVSLGPLRIQTHRGSGGASDRVLTDTASAAESETVEPRVPDAGV